MAQDPISKVRHCPAHEVFNGCRSSSVIAYLNACGLHMLLFVPARAASVMLLVLFCTIYTAQSCLDHTETQHVLPMTPSPHSIGLQAFQEGNSQLHSSTPAGRTNHRHCAQADPPESHYINTHRAPSQPVIRHPFDRFTSTSGSHLHQ